MKTITALLFLVLSLVLYGSDEILDYYAPYINEKGVVKKEHYIVAFNDHTLTPDWTIYAILKPLQSVVKRDGLDFRKDPEFIKSPTDEKYKNCGFDAGHFVPAEDMSFDKKAIKDTFVTSNCAPQWGKFNRGIWKRLETQIRFWGNSGRRLVVLTGGVYRYNLRTINGIGLADGFYKVVYFIDEDLTICYYFNHSADLSDDSNLNAYIVSISELEKRIDITLSRQPYNKDKRRDILNILANRATGLARDSPNVKK
ncbi:DNA/RNA non-specific endonuclease [Candidatus Nomurabacteria bacterium]|nr:DNA/RNA non-specific endonuclease [Candidatus Nomurabacteria bacterium]